VTPELLFYDGHCGLCHGVVRFVLARDPEGAAFRFAPIGGETFRTEVSIRQGDEAPDSIVVLTRNGELLWRSDATIHVLRKLGGVWQVLGSLLALLPHALRDAGYEQVARRRKRWFGEREESCPVVPAQLRTRFDA
jgi:predicted DCC family thiol-disulfide oxidoreductase YuxK